MDKTKIWVDTWQRAATALNEVRQKELRSYDYAKNRHIIDGLLQWAFEHPQPRPLTGLVEQQRYFMILAKNKDPENE